MTNHEDAEHLRALRQKTDDFIQEVFDWVAPLHHQHLLGELYDFKRRIEETLIDMGEKNED